MSLRTRLHNHALLNPFQLFKYLVYFLLIRNIWLFFREEHAVVGIMHADGYAWSEAISVYAATADTFFWVLLLLLFELETWVIPDNRLTTRIKILFTTLRAICYTSIVYAFYGYIGSFVELSDWKAITTTSSDLCAHIGQEFMYSIERFTAVTAENCASLAMEQELLGNGAAMITDRHHFNLSWMLALADVINAADWLLVVVILEIEIWLQTQNKLPANTLTFITAAKILLYSVLGIIAVFWGFYGEFIDFWDAFLWIVAFIFIENNVQLWTKERGENLADDA